MKFYKYIIAILIAFNIITIYSLYTNRNQLNMIANKYWEYDFQINHLLDNRNKLITFHKIQYYAENCLINNIKLYNRDNKELFLQNILSHSPQFIYYFSEKGCTGCFEPFLYKLDSLSNSIGSDNIIVISEFSNNRSFKKFIENKFNKINIYRTKEKLGIINIQDYEYAYAFLTDSNRKAHKVIITDKSNVDFTDEYLKYTIDFFKYIESISKEQVVYNDTVSR